MEALALCACRWSGARVTEPAHVIAHILDMSGRELHGVKQHLIYSKG